VAFRIAESLSPLTTPAAASGQLRVVQDFLQNHCAQSAEDDPFAARSLRARAAIREALTLLEQARAIHDDAPVAVAELAADVRQRTGRKAFPISIDLAEPASSRELYEQVAGLARVMVVVLGAISLWLAIFSSSTLVSLLLTGYAGVTQFFPGVVLGLYWRRAKTAAVFAGMIVGVVTAVFLMLSHHDPLFGLSAGFLALCVNFAIAVIFSAGKS